MQIFACVWGSGCRVAGLVLLCCLLSAPAALAQWGNVPLPLDAETQTFRFDRVAQLQNHHRMEFFFRAAKFVGKAKPLKNILTFDRVVPDSTRIYANGALSTIIDEVRVHITYTVCMEFGFDYYLLSAYNFRMDGHPLEYIYFYPKRFTPLFIQVTKKVFAMADNHVRGVLDTVESLLRDV